MIRKNQRWDRAEQNTRETIYTNLLETTDSAVRKCININRVPIVETTSREEEKQNPFYAVSYSIRERCLWPTKNGMT